ncbi:MAG: PAS domain S-box protein [Nitrospirae bacterium]|nr:PAS domain S-box protein [Nitrospirota bacterium]
MGRKYGFISENFHGFLNLIDTDYKYVAVNDSYCMAHNKKRQEMINKSVSDIWGKGVFEKVIRCHLDSCFKGKVVHYQAQFKFSALGLRTINVSCFPYHNNKGMVTHALVVSRDITKKKSDEKELFALKKAVETMQLGVTTTDTQGIILYTNPAEASMHGYSIEELLGREVNILAPSACLKKRTLGQLNEITSWRREGFNVRRDGSTFPVQLISDVVKDKDGQPIGIVTTCEDITERKKTEDRIQRQLQRLTTLRDIATAILSSLDLKVMLNVLLDHLINRLNIDAAVITLLNRHTLAMEYAESRGFRSNGISNIKLELGEGLAGQVAIERRLISIPNLHDKEIPGVNPLFLKKEGLVAYYGLPLIAKGQVKGILELFHRTTMDPDSEWLEFMDALAAQTAIAIDNATLFNELQSSNIEITRAYDSTLVGWSRALDLRDKETEGHSQRVTGLTMQIARAVGLTESELVHIRRGALLHDIGKLGIPDSILLKSSPLNEEEWEIMKQHPIYAYQMLSPINFLRPALDIPYCHHEKWDGTGYPHGLTGEDIPIAARIFAAADVWDALCSARSYRGAFKEEKAVEHMRSLEGTHFDPEVLTVFLAMKRL